MQVSSTLPLSSWKAVLSSWAFCCHSCGSPPFTLHLWASSGQRIGHDLIEARQAKGDDLELVDAAVQVGLGLGDQTFRLTQVVAHLAVIGLGLKEPGLIVVSVLDEVVAQVDDVGQFSFGVAYVLDGHVQLGIGGFQLLNVLLGFHGLVHAGLVDGGQHLAGDPVLKGLCLGHLAAQNQAVQAGLVDEGGLG